MGLFDHALNGGKLIHRTGDVGEIAWPRDGRSGTWGEHGTGGALKGLGHDGLPEGRKGVIYLEHSYQTEGDKTFSIPSLYEPMSGGHWDLFDGFVMVLEKHSIADNTHEGKMNFWLAR